MPPPDPITQFLEWFEEAKKLPVNEPAAVTLATCTKDGRPSARMVLLKGVDEAGFVFYTNLASRKGRELAENPHVALCFYWDALKQQVRVEGRVEPVTPAEADAYFQSRARDSRIGAWASKQSQPLEHTGALVKRVAEYTAKFGVGDVPRPEFWSGFRLKPERIEFWKMAYARLHDRTVYSRAGDGWATEKLYP